jgi:hypothetical protein
MRFDIGGFKLVILTALSLMLVGCGQPNAVSDSNPDSNRLRVHDASLVVATNPLTALSEFTVPADVSQLLKMKCYLCHGGAETKGGFDFKKMIYQLSPNAEWQPMDWRGATKIKLAILPVDGKPPRMPKQAGSIWNPLTQEEANSVAAWTDYPFK